ncbi:DUF1565 domain-containing protein [Azohydromonas sediminis]|uniref:DUF1565 domain-containing protein n=1 Tax=Azohydromonas sediminis TaxID=2259674 RepID=UPI0013C2FEE5|nr:DUF1565 domain-containing protein [Azohydromonas sediminis]
MKRQTTTARRVLMAAVAVAWISGCGGGGGTGGGAEPNVTAAGAVITSDDGKVTLTIPPGAVSEASTLAIEKVDPDAETAADPLYVPGSLYRIVGSLGTLSEAATWEFATDDVQLAGTRVRGSALSGLPSNPPPDTGKSCNGTGGKPLGMEWVPGDTCPSGCLKSSSYVDGNANNGAGQSYAQCIPQNATYWDSTPAPHCDWEDQPGAFSIGYSVVPREDAEDVYAAMELLRGAGGALCQINAPPAPPLLIGNSATALNLLPCTVAPGKASCKLSQVAAGNFKLLADKTPPSGYLVITDQPPGNGATDPKVVTLNLDGSGTMRYFIGGADNKKAGSFGELWELKMSMVDGPAGPQPQFAHVLLATLPNVMPPGNPTQYLSASANTPPASIPFNQTDPLVRWFYGRVFDAAGNHANTKIVKVTRVSPTVEVASFAASPATIAPPSGTTTLSWTVANATAVSIDQGVGDVTAQTVNDSGSVQVSVDSTRTFTLTASGPNSSTATKTVTVTVAPDTTAPTVTLSANPGTLSAPGSTLLTANVTDNVGVTQVEFYRGATPVGTDGTPGDGFTQSVNLTEADVGNVSFTAKAFDAAGNHATSAATTVLVTLPVSADRYVSPNGSDSNPGTQAQPYKTLTKAFAEVGADGTVWLANGTYTWADEVAAGASAADNRTRPLPAGRTLRASTPGQATLNFGIVAQGAATLIGVNLTTVNGDTNHGYGPAVVLPNNASVQLKGVTFGRFTNVMSYCNGCANATVSLDTNGMANFNYLASDFTGEFTNTNAAHGSGGVTVSGGRFSHPALASAGQGCNQGKFMSLGGSAQVTLHGVAVELGPVSGGAFDHPIAFCIAGGSAKLTLANGSTVTQAGSTSRYRAFALIGAGASLELANATVSGPFFGIVGITGAAQVTIADSTLQGATEGITPNAGEYSEPTVTLTDSVLQNFTGNAIHLPHGGTLSITGGQIQDNGGAGVRLGGLANPPYYGGVYTLTVRNATIANNGGAQADGAGLLLNGAAGSVLDLGTAAQPGGNTLLGLNASKPGVRVGTAAGNTVGAVGNTWVAGQQGASAGGTYAGSVLVTSGNGQNYSVTSGSLRLAGN